MVWTTSGPGSSSPAAWRSTPCTHLTPLGNLTLCSPDPELAELSTVLKLMGLSNMDEDWVSFMMFIAQRRL